MIVSRSLNGDGVGAKSADGLDEPLGWGLGVRQHLRTSNRRNYN